MKKQNIIIIAVLTILSSLISCGQTPQDKIVEFTRETMKDPNSFELIKIKPLDTIHKSDKVSESLNPFYDLVDDYNKDARRSLEYASIYAGSYYSQSKFKRYITEAKDYSKMSQTILNYTDSVLNVVKSYRNTDKDSVVGHTWYISAYANNSKAEKIIGEYEVYVDVKTNKMTLKNLNKVN